MNVRVSSDSYCDQSTDTDPPHFYSRPVVGSQQQRTNITFIPQDSCCELVFVKRVTVGLRFCHIIFQVCVKLLDSIQEQDVVIVTSPKFVDHIWKADE